jgi:hypothetical protein
MTAGKQSSGARFSSSSILHLSNLPNGTRISRGAALHSPLALQEQPQNQIEPRYKGRDSGVGFMRLLVAVQTPGA